MDTDAVDSEDTDLGSRGKVKAKAEASVPRDKK